MLKGIYRSHVEQIEKLYAFLVQEDRSNGHVEKENRSYRNVEQEEKISSLC